jgi:Phosphate-induced protein 1 conserved region
MKRALPWLALALATGLIAYPSAAEAASDIGGGSTAAAVNTSDNVVYHGGPVMAGDMKAYLIFWEPAGSTVSPRFDRLLKRYFRDVGDSGLYANNRQYADTTGGAPTDADLAGVFRDTRPYPAAPLQDADVRAEISRAMTAKGWTPGITHAFFVYTALGESICTPFGFCTAPLSRSCAYHFGFNTRQGPVLYAAMPYAANSLTDCYGLSGTPNHDIAADAEVNVTSHEQMELATDPEASGWFGQGGLLDEIGDRCAGVFGPLDRHGADVFFKGHRYIVQEEWDNTASSCTLTGP